MRKATALLAVIALVVGAAGVTAAASLTVGVDQAPGENATVTVKDNSTVVEGAAVNVTLDDENATYDGTGTYTTDANGTVTLPAPSEDVNVTVTASYNNSTVSTSPTLLATTDDSTNETNTTNETDAFGQEVSSYVLSINQDNDTNTSTGLQVAEFVTAKNPGNAPDHAGPKDVNEFLNETAEDDDDDRGPPEGAGEGNSGGPPDGAGNGSGNGNGGGPPVGAGEGNGNGGGPPDDAGN